MLSWSRRPRPWFHRSGARRRPLVVPRTHALAGPARTMRRHETTWRDRPRTARRRVGSSPPAALEPQPDRPRYRAGLVLATHMIDERLSFGDQQKAYAGADTVVHV